MYLTDYDTSNLLPHDDMYYVKMSFIRDI